MKYFIFIDESGPFDEGITGKAASLVGGVCGVLNDNGWETQHLQQLDEFSRHTGAKFTYPLHYHCGLLLGGKLYVPETATKQHIESFTDSVFTVACRKSAFIFASRNDGKRFEYSPQATYVLNLIAALRKGVEYLCTNYDNIESLEIVVAQRTITETKQSIYPDYTDRLLDFAKDQLLTGESSAVAGARQLKDNGSLVLRSAVGDQNPGLMAADFVCCLLRGGRIPPKGTTVVETEPGDVIFGDYGRYYSREVEHLLEQKQYATAADFLRRYFPCSKGSPDYKVLIDALKKEKDTDVLMRELIALLALARFLINRRTHEAGNLGCSQELLTQLVKIAEPRLTGHDETGVQRAWACLLVDGLADLAACHNHLGAVGPQQAIEVQLTTLLSSNKALLPGSHTTRKERLLDIRNRNLNLLFNDYRFEEIIAVFLGDVESREAEVPKDEPDELLGQMQGSIGQACAFLARTDSSWTDMAHEYFEKSIKHFCPGTLYHAMSSNFLATLAWQSGNLHLACTEMNRHEPCPAIMGPDDLIQKLPQLLTAQKLSAFNAVNYLRIAATHSDTTGPLSRDHLKALQASWVPRMTDDHPHEQLCKWLGYMLLQAGEHESSRQLFLKGNNISKKLGFTVHTIGLTLLGLLALADKAGGDVNAHAGHAKECIDLAETLTAQSTPFATYLNMSGGQDTLKQALYGEAGECATSIAKLLPFSYA